MVVMATVAGRRRGRVEVVCVEREGETRVATEEHASAWVVFGGGRLEGVAREERKRGLRKGQAGRVSGEGYDEKTENAVRTVDLAGRSAGQQDAPAVRSGLVSETRRQSKARRRVLGETRRATRKGGSHGVPANQKTDGHRDGPRDELNSVKRERGRRAKSWKKEDLGGLLWHAGRRFRAEACP